MKKFQEAVQPIIAGINPKEVKFNAHITASSGFNFRAVEGVEDVYKKELKTINHKPGQVLLFDFWATWCESCQDSMSHNQKLLQEHEAAWGDKVRVISISFDEKSESVVKHVEEKGWSKIEHFLKANSSVDKEYGVKGLPRLILIDTHGKIAFTGFPENINVEESIQKLVNGESLGMEGKDPVYSLDDENESF